MTQREEFETWYVKAYHVDGLVNRENGCYMYLPAGMAWDAWQAAKAAQTAQPIQARELSDKEAKELWLYEAGKSGYNTHELPARFLRAAINTKETK